MRKSKVFMALLLASVLSTPGSVTAAETKDTDFTISEEDTTVGDSDFDIIYPGYYPVIPDPETPSNPSNPSTPANPSTPTTPTNPSAEEKPTKVSLVRKEIVLKTLDPTSNNSTVLESQVSKADTLYASEEAGHTKIKFEVGKVGTFAFRIDSKGEVSYRLYSTTNTVVSTAAIKEDSFFDYAVLKKGVYILDVQHSAKVSVQGVYFKNKSNVTVKKYVPAKKKKSATITLKLKKAINGSSIIVKKNRYNPAGNWESPLDVASFSTIKRNAVFKGKVTSKKLKFKVKKNGVYTIINTLNGEKVKTVYTFKVSGLKK